MPIDQITLLAITDRSERSLRIVHAIEQAGQVVLAIDGTSPLAELGMRVTQAVAGLRRLDGAIICGAPAGVSSDIRQCSADDFDSAIDGGLGFAFRAMRGVLPAMIARGDGAVTVLTSVAATAGRAGHAADCAAAHATLGLMRGAALDVAGAGVRVNALCCATDVVDDEADIADLIIFLSSDGARAITGASLPVDRGQSAALAVGAPSTLLAA